jgi:ADP-ribose pyrophosphatase YjhB (NUDIX family)
MKEHLTIKEVIEKYKEAPLRQATLTFLLRENEILLAMKKRGFAQGKWNGSGGKPKPEDKNIEDTAVREMLEETLTKPKNLKHVATLNFYFEEMADWNQQVVVFIANLWEGDPKETEEMAPKWFKKDKIPFTQMWEDDPFWLPLVLEGKSVKADFLFDENQKMVEKDVWVVTDLTK